MTMTMTMTIVAMTKMLWRGWSLPTPLWCLTAHRPDWEITLRTKQLQLAPLQKSKWLYFTCICICICFCICIYICICIRTSSCNLLLFHASWEKQTSQEEPLLKNRNQQEPRLATFRSGTKVNGSGTRVWEQIISGLKWPEICWLLRLISGPFWFKLGILVSSTLSVSFCFTPQVVSCPPNPN